MAADAPKKLLEPFFWTLFSAGGVVAALLMPVHIFLFGLAFPLGWLRGLSHGRALALLEQPSVRIYLFVFCSLPLFHWAHRFRYSIRRLADQTFERGHHRFLLWGSDHWDGASGLRVVEHSIAPPLPLRKGQVIRLAGLGLEPPVAHEGIRRKPRLGCSRKSPRKRLPKGRVGLAH